METVDQRKFKEARDVFHHLLSRKTSEHEWQQFFETYPYVICPSLPLRIAPEDILPLCRQGKTEPDFIFYPRKAASIPFWGVIELKKPESPIVTLTRKNVAILSRDAETAVEQAKEYINKPQLWIPTKLSDEILLLGNHAYLFIIMGMSKELSQKLANQLYYKMIQDRLPGNLRILPYDYVLKRFEAEFLPHIHLLVPQSGPIISRNIHEILDNVMYDLGESLIDSREVASAIASTNAYAFGIDEYHIVSAFYDEDADEISFSTSFSLSGEQDEDSPWVGGTIQVEVSGVVSREHSYWEIIDYTIASCTTDF